MFSGRRMELPAPTVLASLMPGCKQPWAFYSTHPTGSWSWCLLRGREDNAFSTPGVFLGLCPLACGCAIHSTGFKSRDWMCSLFQYSASCKYKRGINWLKWVRHFPAPAHLQSPEEGDSKYQWGGNQGKGPGKKRHILEPHSHADFMLKLYAVFLSVTGGMAGCMSGWCFGVIGGHAHLPDDQNRGLLVNTKGSCPDWGQSYSVECWELPVLLIDLLDVPWCLGLIRKGKNWRCHFD